MIDFRDRMAAESGIDLLVHTNQDGVARGINPFDHGSSLYTQVMKTEALKQALDQHGFDAAFGGARRDEEKSRAKERIFSFRTASHTWDPKNQRPELWSLYNTRVKPGESIRVFPLSNWTELDIWQYILVEKISRSCRCISPASVPVVERDGQIDHGRRRPPAACARRNAGHAPRPLPHAGLLSADRRRRIRRRRLSRTSSPRC